MTKRLLIVLACALAVLLLTGIGLLDAEPVIVGYIDA